MQFKRNLWIILYTLKKKKLKLNPNAGTIKIDFWVFMAKQKLR